MVENDDMDGIDDMAEVEHGREVLDDAAVQEAVNEILASNVQDPIARLKAAAAARDAKRPQTTKTTGATKTASSQGNRVVTSRPSQNRRRSGDLVSSLDEAANLEAPRYLGPGIVGPNGEIIIPDEVTNSLGQPRRMTPEEAHAKLVGLRVYTRSFWDAQKHRIKIGNRAFSGVTDEETVADIRQSAQRTEDLLSKALIANFKASFPEIYAWTEETPGLGPKLMGRLLGEIGHPCWAFPSHWEGKGETRKLVSDPPFMRNPAKLFAYCGVGDPKRRPFKGMTDKDVYAMGNPKAKMLVHLLAESCMKQQGTGNRRRSPYRDIYDLYRARYVDRVEIKVDPKTGEKIEKPWSDGHQHNAALRVTGKEILLDLWVKAEQTL